MEGWFRSTLVSMSSNSNGSGSLRCFIICVQVDMPVNGGGIGDTSNILVIEAISLEGNLGGLLSIIRDILYWLFAEDRGVL